MKFSRSNTSRMANYFSYSWEGLGDALCIRSGSSRGRRVVYISGRNAGSVPRLDAAEKWLLDFKGQIQL
jgi:hypothetical protein